SRAGQADALGFWKELKSHAPLTDTDLRDEAAVAVKAKETEVAEEVIGQLMSRPHPTPSDVLLAAELAIQKQDFDGALDRVHKVLHDTTAADRDRLTATIVLSNVLRSKEVRDQSEVFEHLVQLARGTNEVS